METWVIVREKVHLCPLKGQLLSDLRTRPWILGSRERASVRWNRKTVFGVLSLSLACLLAVGEGSCGCSFIKQGRGLCCQGE